jgi:hypothetical protein
MPFGSTMFARQPGPLPLDELSTLHPVGIWPTLSSSPGSFGIEALALVIIPIDSATAAATPMVRFIETSSNGLPHGLKARKAVAERQT